MPNYIVQRTLPSFTSEQLASAASSAKSTTAQMSQEGTPVRYLRSFFIPGEDKCFCLFQGPSAQAVKQANDRAGLPYDSISEGWHIQADELN